MSTAARPRPSLLDAAPHRGRGILWTIAALAFVLGHGAALHAGDTPPESAPQPTRQVEPFEGEWPDDVIEVASHIPIQDGGRIKPLSTFADFTILGFSGRKRVKHEDGRKYHAVAWLLDLLYRPAQAMDAPVFLVTDSDALVAIGLEEIARKKRDRYSYRELRPGIEALSTKASEYRRKPERSRSRIENQVVLLSRNLDDLERIRLSCAFKDFDFPVDGDEALSKALGGATRVRWSTVLEHRGALQAFSKVHQGRSDEEKQKYPKTDLILGAVDMTVSMVQALQQDAARPRLTLFPPSSGVKEEPSWHTGGFLLTVPKLPPEMLSNVKRFEKLSDHVNEPGAFLGAINEYQAGVKESAERRGEYSKIGLEVLLYKLALFHWSLFFFLFAFVLTAFWWLKPSLRKLKIAITGLTILGVCSVTLGIVLRCIIRERPPVSTLYETVLFITAVGIIACLITERINKMGIALSAAPILGALGMFMANRYEEMRGTDTMPSLMAVLDTNFWLATHVTTVTIGYSAGLLASGLGHLFVLGKAFGLKRDDNQFYVSLGRMVYGMVAFGLIFSTIGTILGGVWANDSWGRFWGWDPKENGALMIVLGNLAILHARLGGFIGTFGMAMSTIALGIVVAFSWWGVNLLGVGLHSYGFTAGIQKILNIFYAIEGAVLVTGFYWLWWSSRARTGGASGA
ncbi:MAG: cytochrome c biogenesis protein CcsA [bacterium]|nr:cytochrome c biogenesis protein CcsA [bacterium]